MKKKLNLIFTTMLMVTIASLPLFTSGCKSTSVLGSSLGNNLNIADYKAAGEAVGEAGYYAYAYLKQDGKYSKYIF